MICLLVLPMTLFGSLGAFFFKKSTERAEHFFLLFRIPYFYVGGILYVSGALLNILLLRFMDYTVIYPMGSISYIWSLFLSHCLLGERITRKKVAGVALIFAGVVLLSRQ